MILEAAGRLFFAPGFARVSRNDLARKLGRSNKTIYRHLPNKRSLLATVLDQQLAAVKHTPVAAAKNAEGQPFGARTQRFLIAAGSELRRISTAQLTTRRGQYGEQRMDTMLHQRLEELSRDDHRRALLPTPPEPLSEITPGAGERLLTSPLPREPNCTTTTLPRATVNTMLYQAIRSTHPSIDKEQPQAVMLRTHDNDQEAGP